MKKSPPLNDELKNFIGEVVEKKLSVKKGSGLVRLLKNRIFLAKAQRTRRNSCKFAEKICVYPCSSVAP